MPAGESRAEYPRRMHAVQEYVDAHLDRALELDELAALSLVSQPELPVLNVALAVGFGSPEAFARAFEARFGSTPSAWRAAEREKRKPGQAKRKRDAPAQTRYDACVEIPGGFVGTGSYLTTTIPGGRYAVARFEGRADRIGEAWAALLRDWLPQSGMQLDARPFFEHYPPASRFDPKTGVFDCELCIPVATV